MRNIFDDEFSSLLAFEIEALITDYDDAANSRGIRLTDSNVRSVLSKARKSVEGGNPVIPKSNEKEKMLAFMSTAIIKMIDANINLEPDDGESASIAEDWLTVIRAIEHSVKLRKSPMPGGRDYLDYIENFIKNARKLSAEKGRDARRGYRMSSTPKCGLCGKTEKLVKTECCGNWICDDEDKYVMFSYERNSCRRNHSRYTLCGGHHSEGHPGDWKTCELCRKHCEDEPEVYADMGTNEYNFEVLENPPPFESKRCSVCSKIIRQGSEGYTVSPGKKYTCSNCHDFTMPDFTGKDKSAQQNAPK